MSKRWLLICFLIFFVKLHAQVSKDSIDLKYLEDQLYLSLTTNVLFDMPDGISQNGFSGGVSFGFIKDFPINKQRNFGFGVGLGYSYNTYIQNLKITRQDLGTQFETAQNYKSNRLGFSALELPVEIRWRNSTPQKYKFWRVYGGFKVSYILAAKTRFSDDEATLRTKNISEFNRLQYGLTLATGYSTWNLYLYYGLTPFFENVDFKGKDLNMTDFKIGLKFYIM